jgi:hypothetical protein
MERTLRTVASLLITGTLAGCQFTTPEGRPLKLSQYDSIMVESVELAPEVTDEHVAPLLEGYTKVVVLESKRWKLTGDFDLEAFAKKVEEYSTTPGTIDGKPVEPLVNSDEILEKHAEANERWKAMLAEPKGTKPIHLRMLVTDLRFPDFLEGVTLGTQPRMRCTVEVYADGKLLGSGDMEAISGLPGVPFYPSSMVGRAAKALIIDEFTRETVLKLIKELGDETVDALTRAR